MPTSSLSPIGSLSDFWVRLRPCLATIILGVTEFGKLRDGDLDVVGLVSLGASCKIRRVRETDGVGLRVPLRTSKERRGHSLLRRWRRILEWSPLD